MRRIALVVYDGVLDDECEAFRSVLGELTGTRVVTIGADRRPYRGPGGAQHPDLTFAELDEAEVVVVPGGIGCERATDDLALREFLVRMERTARYLAASSTGTVVLASAGLLHGDAAATHWLASDLLRKYGSEADDRRLVVTRNIITCEGRISAVDAAFAVVERVAGSVEVERIRATLLVRGEPLLATPSWSEEMSQRLATRLLGRPTWRRPRPVPSAPYDVADGPPVTPFSVMIELVDDEETVRRLQRAQRRRERRRR